MFDDLAFGWRTAVLTVAVAQMLIVAVALTRPLANRAANRALAVLLVVLAGLVTPWLIGFAGFYDRWRWLSFAPFQIGLAVGPLTWAYVHALVEGGWPPRLRRHLAAPLLQFAFLAASFLLPIAVKERWSDLIGRGYDVAASTLTMLSLAAYALASLALLRRYREALAGARGDDGRFAARWLGRAIAALALLVGVWSAYTIRDWFDPLGYFDLMGLYAAIAALGVWLAVEGWRHAEWPFPHLGDLVPAPAPQPRDWRAEGERWAAAAREGGWAADPELDLAGLARRLGTNTGYLSRALNEGLGVNFSTFVNGLRAEAVAARLRAGDTGDLLDLALEAGFNSKASFNRAFAATFGTSPSAYRRRVSKAE